MSSKPEDNRSIWERVKATVSDSMTYTPPRELSPDEQAAYARKHQPDPSKVSAYGIKKTFGSND